MASEIEIPAGMGLRLEDLQYVRSVVIVGEEAYFLNNGTPQPNQSAPNVHEYAVDNGDGWFSKADGHKYAMTRYDDLGFLALMPRLQSLSFALADIPELPDLSGTQLRTVEFFNCTIDRLDWFDTEMLENVTIYGCPVKDFSPLNASTRTLRAEFGFSDEINPDLSGFHPENLISLNLNGSAREIKMPDLGQCGKLHDVRLRNLSVEDLDFLRGGDIYQLEIDGLDRLRDLSGLSGMAHLSELQIHNCRQLRDYTPIGACTGLKRLYIDTGDDVIRDASFLEGLTSLREVELQGNLPDLNFLRGMGGKNLPIVFCFRGRCADLSALESVKKYERLFLLLYDADFSAAAPYLKHAQIDTLALCAFRNLDLSLIPRDTMHLELTNCSIGQDLTGFPELYLTRLTLQDIPALRSLEGLQKLKRFEEVGKGTLEIRNCPRLTDWSVLEGKTLDGLELAGVYSLPDFSRLRFHSLKLDSLDWLEDLSCLDALDGSYKSYQNFSLPGMEQIRDLSPIARVVDSGGRLEIPPQLEEQARDLLQSGKILWYEIVFPEGGWEQDNSELSLLSLDELDTLPPALLRRVSSLAIAGDTVFDMDDYEIWTHWKNGRNNYVLVDRATREETPIHMGAITDLSVFSPLTNLRRLCLVCQPIKSLDGVQDMEALETLQMRNCPELHDLSPAFAVQSLSRLMADETPVESIQGVQNLYRLHDLTLNNTQVSDLTPLKDCDFGAAMQRGGLCLGLSNIPCRDFSALSAVPQYRYLNLFGDDCALWLEAVQNCRIESLEAGGDKKLNNASLAKLAADHPELRELNISWQDNVTDLTPLLELDSLEEVRVSRNMTQAIDSLNGKDLRFQLNIEG